MRRTGKLYSLTLVSASLGVVASVSVSLWNFNTPEVYFWLDLIPHGFGVASMITTTLIVSFRAARISSPYPAAIIGHDCKHIQGRHRSSYGYHLSFPDDRSGARGQLERDASPGHPYERASGADHRTWGYRGLIYFLSNLPPAQLTLVAYHRRSLNRSATAPRSSLSYHLDFSWQP